MNPPSGTVDTSPVPERFVRTLIRPIGGPVLSLHEPSSERRMADRSTERALWAFTAPEIALQVVPFVLLAANLFGGSSFVPSVSRRIQMAAFVFFAIELLVPLVVSLDLRRRPERSDTLWSTPPRCPCSTSAPSLPISRIRRTSREGSYVQRERRTNSASRSPRVRTAWRDDSPGCISWTPLPERVGSDGPIRGDRFSRPRSMDHRHPAVDERWSWWTDRDPGRPVLPDRPVRLADTPPKGEVGSRSTPTCARDVDPACDSTVGRRPMT